MDITKLKQDIAALEAISNNAVATITDLVSQVHSLQQQGAESVKQSDLDAIAATVESTVAALTAAVPPIAPPAPTSGATTTAAGSVASVDASAAGAETASGTPASAPRSVYTFDGDPASVANDTEWQATDLVTTDVPARALYHFAGDTATGDAKGDGVNGVWHLYTGPTQPASAVSSGATSTAAAPPADTGNPSPAG